MGVLLGTLCFTTSLYAEQPQLRLELHSQQQTLRLGQEIQVELRIIGPGVDRIAEGTPGRILSTGPFSGFVHKIRVKPEQEGPLTLGPYQLSFNGAALESNVLHIDVLPPLVQQPGTFLRVSKTEVRVGESFELTIESRLEAEKGQTDKTFDKASDVRLKYDPRYSFTSGGMRQHMQILNGAKSVNWSRSYVLTPKMSGVLHMAQLMEGLPKDSNIPDVIVNVRPGLAGDMVGDPNQGFYVRVDKSQIKLGESFTLMVTAPHNWKGRTAGKAEQPHPTMIDTSPLFVYKKGSTHYEGPLGHQDHQWRSAKFIVTPRKKGAFRIHAGLFRGIPSGITFSELTVMVMPE